MPPVLALVLTIGFIVFLFWQDFRKCELVPKTVWIPAIWVFLIATKPVSKWLSIFGVPGFVSTSVEEGSSLDAVVFLSLILIGISVLRRRQVSFGTLFRNNPWLGLFVVYCILAIIWSDFPFVSLKRWIKILGHPIMVAILLTEAEPQLAVTALFKRCAYVFLPLSICWMKYFPALGRRASEYGGMSNCGLADSKNVLGGICWILLFFFLWYFLQIWSHRKDNRNRYEFWLIVGLMALSSYCVWKASSAAAVIAFLLASTTLFLLGLRAVNKQMLWAYAIIAILALVAGQLTFDWYGGIVGLSGHEATIEGRGRLWQTLLAMDTSPILGEGFESYWIGERVDKIWAMPDFWWHPNQAHNGYLELYLNLGIVGLCIFAGVVISTFQKIRVEMFGNFEWCRLEFGLLVGILAHNWTEAGFKGLSFSFFVFFLISMRCRQPAWIVGSNGPAQDGIELVGVDPCMVADSRNRY